MCILGIFTSVSASEDSYLYGVVIDAGSSGTRVLAFKFKRLLTGTRELQLVDAYHNAVEPGVSAYTDAPEKAAETIIQLLKGCEVFIPPEQRNKTSLVVRGTAGLRMMPKKKSDRMINHISRAIASLAYKVATDAVKIMSGEEEGIHIWYTVNLLMNTTTNTVATMDLGGGSTQISYQVDEETAKQLPAEDIHKVTYKNMTIKLFTHSHSHLGVDAAKVGVFRLEAGTNSSRQFLSVCVETGSRPKFLFGSEMFVVRGAALKGCLSRYTQCDTLVKQYLTRSMAFPLPQPPACSITAESYFYDLAVDSGILDKNKTSGYTSVAKYRETAARVCSLPNAKRPWECFELLYVANLLEYGFKIGNDTSILLVYSVDQYRASWALGLAYTIAVNDIVNAS